MPQPTQGDLHVNTPLSNISLAFMQDQSAFIADKVFPNIPVQKQSDRYYTYDRGYFNRDEMELRAPSTETAGSGYTVDNTPTYFCPVYGFHHDIDDPSRANADSVLSLDAEATELCTLKALIKREKLFVSKYFAGGLWTNDYDGVASGENNSSTFRQWNDAASTPIESVRAWRTIVQESTGFRPNTMVLGQKVLDALYDHPDIIDRVKYGQTPGSPADINVSDLQNLFKIPRILVMESIENTAKEGATNSHSFIGGKKMLLCYSAPRPGLRTPTAGYTFSWTGYMGASGMGSRIKRFRMENIASDRIEIEMSFDQKLVSADLGVFLDTAVA